MGERTITDRPLSFSGDLELWYFFQRLLMPSRLWPLRRLEPELIDIVQEPRLAGGDSDTPPTLLFTSAWASGAGGDFQRAAQLLGDSLSGLPLTIRYHVDHALDPDRLSDLLGFSSKSSFIWIHTGPVAGGSPADFDGKPVTPPEWLSTFQHRENVAMPLALFLCGQSTEIARHFAEAGAGITIGFEEETLARGSRRLAVDILHAAVHHRGRQEAILTALHSGHLDPNDGSAARPVAFVSRPK